MTWHSFEDGATIGDTGSEQGIILRDEEHVDGARITLEDLGSDRYGITCGIYQVMVHTAWAVGRACGEETYDAMKRDLNKIVADENTNKDDLEEFVQKY